MTAQEITLVQDSFAKLSPIADQAAALFYARLFELDPSLRHLFHGDMETQGRKLMQMIALAVASLAQPDTIAPILREMGARHTKFGVRNEHYATVGSALLWTLAKGLGSDLSPAAKGAWIAMYAFVSGTMLEGARSISAAA